MVRFKFSKDGATVLDTKTGLIWARNANIAGRGMNWQEAMNYVQGLDVGGQRNWRLPNKDELVTLIQAGGVPQLVTIGFSNVEPNVYWSSFTSTEAPGSAWGASTVMGYMALFNKTFAFFVWPVRSDSAPDNNKGLTYSQEKSYRQGLADNNKAIGLNQKNGVAYKNRGELDIHEKNHDADYAKAIELNSRDANWYGSRGHIHFTKKNYDAALADYNKAIELNPKNDAYYNIRGLIHFKKKNYEAALADYNKAIELAPKNEKTYKNRESVYNAIDKAKGGD
jgi:tetratricopeptide (TPR) repeat protein